MIRSSSQWVEDLFYASLMVYSVFEGGRVGP